MLSEFAPRTRANPARVAKREQKVLKTAAGMLARAARFEATRAREREHLLFAGEHFRSTPDDAW
jgi:hypothetical protein